VSGGEAINQYPGAWYIYIDTRGGGGRLLRVAGTRRRRWPGFSVYIVVL